MLFLIYSRILFLLAIVKKILRCIFGKTQDFLCKSLFKDFKVLTLPSLYIFNLITYIYKHKDFLTMHQDIHSYDTHEKTNYCLPYSRLQTNQNSYIY